MLYALLQDCTFIDKQKAFPGISLSLVATLMSILSAKYLINKKKVANKSCISA